MQNNELIEKLLQEDVHENSSNKAKNLIANQTRKDEDLSISKIRVVTAKYKIFIAILLIAIVVIFFEYRPKVKQSYDAAKKTYQSKQTQIESTQKDIKLAEEDKAYL